MHIYIYAYIYICIYIIQLCIYIYIYWFDPVMLITKLQSVANLQAKEGGNACGKSLKMWVKSVVHLPATFSRTKFCSKDKCSSHAEKIRKVLGKNKCVPKKGS